LTESVELRVRSTPLERPRSFTFEGSSINDNYCVSGSAIHHFALMELRRRCPLRYALCRFRLCLAFVLDSVFEVEVDLHADLKDLFCGI
jgi:hypothetical protein